MNKSLLLFAVGAFILFAFLPIIGSLTTNASERIKTENISFTIVQDNTEFVLTETQYNALLSAYNGEALQLKFTTPDGTFILINNFELVDATHTFSETSNDIYILRDGPNVAESPMIFQFYTFNGFKFFQFFEQTFQINGQQVTLINPTEYVITLSILTTTPSAPLLQLIPVLAVIIFTSLAVLFIKIKQ